MVALNGNVYAAGGDDGTSNLQSVEVLAHGAWSRLPHDMPIARSYAGIAVIDKA